MVLLVILGSFLTSALDLVFPMIVRKIINDALPTGDMRLLLSLSALLLVLYIISYAAMYWVNYKGRAMSINMENDMRRDLFAHLQDMSFRFFDNTKTGQLLARLTGDIQEIGELAFRLPHDAVVCGFTMVGTIFMLLYLNLPLGLLITALLLLKTWHAVAINRKMKAAFRENRRRNGELTAQTSEALSGIRIVKAFAQEDVEQERFMKGARDLAAIRKKSYRLLARFTSSVNFFTNITNLAVLVSGGFMIYAGRITLSDFIAYLLYVNLFMRPLYRLTVLLEMGLRGMAGFTRFEEMMALQPDITDAPDALPCPEFKGEIEFRRVSFSYTPEHPVLQNLDFTVRPGETVAFVGETGAGKTTVSSLLLRFYEPQSGAILIDGTDIRRFRQKELRSRFGVVQQDVFLFSDSVRENIAYGVPGATDAQIRQAAELAAADEFIRNLPDGYDTQIGERGVKLSGGQKQRLAIARVFLKNPPIVIFDEATSALDNKTEAMVQESLEKLARNRTTLVIAHRLSTVRNADRIIVMSGGRVAESGSHAELMARKGTYYRLYTAQQNLV
jgi:ATP-binding cassette subfamily B protein